MWAGSESLFSLCLISGFSSLFSPSDITLFFFVRRWRRLQAILSADSFKVLTLLCRALLWQHSPFRQPALQQIMWCHHYLVCAARGLRDLNKQTDRNIISTGRSQHVAAALFTRDARHPTPMSAAWSSSTQSSRRCEWEPCKSSCLAVEEWLSPDMFLFVFQSPSLAAEIRIGMSFVVIVKQVATRLEHHLLVACKRTQTIPLHKLRTLLNIPWLNESERRHKSRSDMC